MAKDRLVTQGLELVRKIKEQRALDGLKDTKIARLEAEVMRLDDENKRLREELKKSKAV